MRKAIGALFIGGAMGLLALPAAAQERPPRADSVARLDLPEVVASAVVDFFNDPRRTRHDGDTRIAAGEVVRGDLAILAGDLTVEGRIEGSVVLVNGNASLRPGSEITGDLLVVGGSVSGLEGARVHGEILSYPERLEYREDGRRIRRVPRPVSRVPSAPSSGRSDFLITTGKSYNRVEGLPITFGPRVGTAGSNPFRIHALGIYRTESGFTLEPERMGYYVRAEQFLGGHQEVRIGATAHSVVEPIEEWHLSDLENGLATFLFHRDFRDHYEREGVSLFTQWEPRPGPLSLGAEVRWERHAAVETGSPWTLFNNAEPWRHQPLVASGRLTSAVVHAGYDTRIRAHDPASGWLVRGRVENGFNVGLRMPAVSMEPISPPGSGAAPLREPVPFGGFRSGFVDLRRYNRVDAESRLNFRFLAGGSLDGRPLPPQRQHALGGEGSLPGYPLFSLDCGARDRLIYRPAESGPGTAFFPSYGCDSFALLQAEFRGKLAFRLRFDSAPWEDGADESHGWDLDLDIAPDWVLFVDAARAWSHDGAGRDEDLAADVGLGILVNRVGLFLARPLTRGSGMNVFVRLGPRF